MNTGPTNIYLGTTRISTVFLGGRRLLWNASNTTCAFYSVQNICIACIHVLISCPIKEYPEVIVML